MTHTEKPKVVKKTSSRKKKALTKKKTKKKSVIPSSLVPISPNSTVKLQAGTTNFIGLDKKKYRIGFRQKLFCEHYLEESGNGVEAVISAGYDVNYKDSNGNDTGRPNRNLAHVIASENLRKPTIFHYINLKLEQYGFTDDNVEKQHLFLINQHTDLNVKAKGIDLYYKVKNKYPAPSHHDFQTPAEIEEAILYIRRILPAPAK